MIHHVYDLSVVIHKLSNFFIFTFILSVPVLNLLASLVVTVSQKVMTDEL